MSSKKIDIEGNPHEMNRRTFLQKTTMVVGAAVGATLVNSLTGLPVSAVSGQALANSNGNKPDLVFPVISDVHIKSSNNQNLDKFLTTLEQLNQVAPRQDVFVVVGDLTDNGYAAEYDKFFTAYNKKRQNKAVSMFAIGNHDYWNGLPVSEAQNLFLTKTGMEAIYFHRVIKGYHFIILGTEDGLTEGTFSERQIGWLAERLKAAADDDPHKPIFVFHHQPIKGTIYGSEWGFSKNRDLFYDALKPYPQVIAFSGHTHYPLDDPRIIHQKDFTSIGTSTGAYLWLETGRIQGEVPEGADFLNQALIVEVHQNKVLIKRRDIHHNDWTGAPFEINYPAKPNKFTYTENRDKKAPYFTKDAMISVVHDNTAAAGLTIMLTQAKDDLLVHDYKLKAKNMETGNVDKELLAFSEFYKDPMPNPLTLQINGLTSNTLYEIEVSALDAFGNESQRSLKVLGKTSQGPAIRLSKTELIGTEDRVDVMVENVRVPNGDWVGVYEVNEQPGSVPAIWWMYTEVVDGICTFTYDPKNNAYPGRYKEGGTYKLVYFYGSGYDAAAESTFTVISK